MFNKLWFSIPETTQRRLSKFAVQAPKLIILRIIFQKKKKNYLSFAIFSKFVPADVASIVVPSGPSFSSHQLQAMNIPTSAVNTTSTQPHATEALSPKPMRPVQAVSSSQPVVSSPKQMPLKSKPAEVPDYG